MTNGQKKASSSKQKNAPDTLVVTFMKEVKKASGLTHYEIAGQLDPKEKYSLTEVSISQYLTGKKAMSEHRLLMFARRAKALGWNIPCAQSMLEWDEIFIQERLDESSEILKKIHKSDERSKKAAISSLEKAINTLASVGLDDKTIVGLAIMQTQKFMPPDALTHGGIVNSAWLREALGQDASGYPEMECLTWQFMSLNEAEKCLPSLVTTAPTKSKPSKINPVKTTPKIKLPAKASSTQKKSTPSHR